MAKQKYIFHASKVDRIAIVDRPAVPDAEVLIYKSRNPSEGQEPIEKSALDFEREYAGAKASSAVQVLESMFWRTVYDPESKDKIGDFKKILTSFQKALVEVFDSIPYSESQKAEGPSVEEMMLNFKRGMEVTAITEAFTYFKQSVYYLVASAEFTKNASAIAKAMCDTFGEFVEGHSETVISKMKETIVVDKEGRIISTARLRKLREAVSVLSAILEEATPKEDKIEEAQKMEPEQILEMLTKALEPIQARLDSFDSLLKEKGIIVPELTEEQKKEKEEAEKLEVEKAEAEAKAKADAEAEALKKETEVAEKRESEMKELKEKSEKVDGMETELKAIKETLTKYEKAFSAFEKRTGIKVSLDVGERTSEKGSGDPFAEAMKMDKK